ncbi:hypothetical protein [Trinickia symbiotica]|uniref:hypothetical protein n=1 Tax=Trinickia symbiotica TaxID=863227 RepID=UPI00036FE849|nr:hypothetical protein [Trinickia symbiotica]
MRVPSLPGVSASIGAPFAERAGAAEGDAACGSHAIEPVAIRIGADDAAFVAGVEGEPVVPLASSPA